MRTTMKRYLTTVFIVIVGAILLSPLLAQAGECGVGGEAKSADGRLVVKTDQEAKDQQARIGEDGYWWTCPKPKVEAPVLPRHCYPVQHEAFRTWAADGHACTTWRKYATSPRDPARDRVIKENETDLWTQWTGPMRGQLIERCVAGERKVVGATCRPVTHCDHKWSTSSNGGKTAYVIDARGRNQVPVGQTAQAVAADGKTITVRCTVNGFTTR